MNKLSLSLLLAGAGLVLTLTAAAPASNHAAPPAELGLMQLREDFHLASSLGDYDLMLSLWADDAVFQAGGFTIAGAVNITDFLSSNPLWGSSVTLTSESKTSFDVVGNTATYAFECIIVRVDAGDPLSTSLSSIPPGVQNPDVEVVQHSNTMGVAVREDGRWKFLTFNGAGGAL